MVLDKKEHRLVDCHDPDIWKVFDGEEPSEVRIDCHKGSPPTSFSENSAKIIRNTFRRLTYINAFRIYGCSNTHIICDTCVY